VSVLLDTSVLVGMEQRRLGPADVPGPAALSVVTVEELWLGVLLTPEPARAERRRTYDAAVALHDVLPVDEAVARACGEIRAEGRERRVRYAPFDSLIGATARVHGLPLLTQNEGMVGMLGVDVRLV
jgi:predicted nucleic acid-binding protein